MTSESPSLSVRDYFVLVFSIFTKFSCKKVSCKCLAYYRFRLFTKIEATKKVSSIGVLRLITVKLKGNTVKSKLSRTARERYLASYQFVSCQFAFRPPFVLEVSVWMLAVEEKV